MTRPVLKVIVRNLRNLDRKLGRVLAVGGDPKPLEPFCKTLSHFAWDDDLSPIQHNADGDEREGNPEWTHIALFFADGLRWMTKWFPSGGSQRGCSLDARTTRLQQVGSNCRRDLHFLCDQVFRKLPAEEPVWFIIENDPAIGLFEGLYWLKDSREPDNLVAKA
jgi:hypothetical protein